ncbi:MAG: family 78 glycoside hydrolase catalytic domain, partial [Niabella sp.]|nr:family 78 glycoside hydrolase catalytic domain [Niabella sp.]
IKTPIKITEPVKGTYVVDMGENFAGTFRIKLRGHSGDTVRFRLGERIAQDGRLNPMTAVAGQIKKKGFGGPGAPELAAQEGMYIFGKDTLVEYTPRFSFAVYRYMEVCGLRKVPDSSQVRGLALSANVLDGNHISTSNSLITAVQDATRRTFLSNLMSVQSDCPGREKFPYGGDLLATDEAFICNFGMQAFYRKVLYDWTDAVQDSVFIDTAPYVGLKYCGLTFESAMFDVQQNLYLYYGDTAIIRELYDFDLKWMDKANRLHPSGIVDKGLADHESLVNVPVQLMGTIAYLKAVQIMKGFSVAMQDKANELRFENLEKKIKNQLRGMYWSGTRSMETVERQSREASMAYINTLPEEERKKATAELQNRHNVFNKQTFYTLLLSGGVIPENEQPAAVDSLLKAIDDAPEGHFTTGIFGTKYILEELSRCGYADRVFNIVNSTRFPGWGFMISKGATTLWETWKESDDVYSNCHPMFGSVSAWFYRWLAGIRPLAPGFKRFVIDPLLSSGLSTLRCQYKTPLGIISLNWARKNGGYAFSVTVPESGEATFCLPANVHSVMIKDAHKNTPYKQAVLREHKFLELPGGQYLIQTQ